jgi:hypothetical protein
MRTAAAVLWMLVSGLAAVALMFGGIGLAAIGGLDLWARHGEYQVGFKESGDDCGIENVVLDVESGEPLFCTTVLIVPSTEEASFTGFTDEQNADVFELARELAQSDGLSEFDQRQIQSRVDLYAGTVPPERRRQHPFWSGANNVVAGLGAAGLGVLLAAFVRSRVS